MGEENDRHEGLAAEVEREVGGDGGDGNALPPPPWAKMEHYLETLDGDRASGQHETRAKWEASYAQTASLSDNSSKTFPTLATPVVKYIDTGKQVLRDAGGSDITVHGANFGDSEAEVRVKVGATWAPRAEWISSQMVVAKSPKGVGANLPLGVWVSQPAYQPAFGFAQGMFSYTRPFIYDIIPFQVGSPYQGPMNVTLKAWGVGYWDTHPEAQLDGHACKRTLWVDNSSVICEIPMHARISPENPEIKVEGQRSMCGITAPGICTVSVGYGSVSSPARIRQEINELKSRGGDWKAALQRWKSREVVGDWGSSNTDADPCTNVGNCKPRTFISSLSGAVLMMTGMGSLCICILALRPLLIWIADDWERAKEDAMHDEYEDLLEASETEGLEYVDEEADEADEHKRKQQQFSFDVRVF